MFGRKIRAPTIANIAYEIAVARAVALPMMIDARKTSVNVPRSAPIMKGIAFLRLMILATARGTNNPIVILDEKRIAVRKTPMK